MKYALRYLGIDPDNYWAAASGEWAAEAMRESERAGRYSELGDAIGAQHARLESERAAYDSQVCSRRAGIKRGLTHPCGSEVG